MMGFPWNNASVSPNNTKDVNNDFPDILENYKNSLRAYAVKYKEENGKWFNIGDIEKVSLYVIFFVNIISNF